MVICHIRFSDFVEAYRRWAAFILRFSVDPELPGIPQETRFPRQSGFPHTASEVTIHFILLISTVNAVFEETMEVGYFFQTVQGWGMWADEISDDDRRMMDNSKQDYLRMLQRAPGKLAAFSLAPIAQTDSDRTRVFFHLLTTEGTDIASSFEMIQLEGQWKPVLAMGWRYPKDASSFFTSPVFGPTIDLQQ
jgi:hypothetical protein